MNNSPDEEQSRALQPRPLRIPASQPPPFPTSSEHLNGEAAPTSCLVDSGEGESSMPIISDADAAGDPGQNQDLPGAAPTTGEGNPGQPDDVAFESFHRSFTIGGNVLDNLGTTPRSGDGPFPSVAPTETQDQAPSPMTPSPVPPPVIPEAQLSQLHEDPTVVQARKSMMARTGDRHARGKLPGPTEGRFVAPDRGSAEPQIPTPRSSKRYTRKKQRLPDFVVGYLRTDTPAPLKSSEHVITCRRCDKSLGALKASVAIRCKACGEVNPASPGNRYHQPRFSAG
ncbi:expressed unknown protein [Seminavis robusta]|uniref:Uncharacterized protein n=1 Tax=Seminavis robusta TaxID=568900 RepID=A0A9N8DRS6_9STRA|nr:expressed unknown protein [Seminavis robusta]|eukprot:Sro323_g117380.1 n/a (284) ;mRNA; f:59510-60361